MKQEKRHYSSLIKESNLIKKQAETQSADNKQELSDNLLPQGKKLLMTSPDTYSRIYNTNTADILHQVQQLK